MFPAKQLSRRGLLFAAGNTAGAATLAAAPAIAAAPPGAADYDVPPDPTKVPGRQTGLDGGYGTRSQFETAARLFSPDANKYAGHTLTPLADLYGEITPSGLHYERHHAGIPTIDPAKHLLALHGLVATPKLFTMADIKRMPAVTRRYFIECSGNSANEWRGPSGKSVQVTHGLFSTSDWTGVRFTDLADQVGLKPEGSWVLAEGADGAVMTRSIPMEKMLGDALIVYGQNGEALRPEQGYPLRLLLPGYEGNTHIKWLQSLQVSDHPFMTREETSRYTDLMPNGQAWQFVFAMDAKSVITFPSGGMSLPGPGFYEITGLAWSGRGRVTSVEISMDRGASWQTVPLDNEPRPVCPVRFNLPWQWTGAPAALMSRCTDETGSVQPSREELVARRGLNAIYHYNGIQIWHIGENGSVSNAGA